MLVSVDVSRTLQDRDKLLSVQRAESDVAVLQQQFRVIKFNCDEQTVKCCSAYLPKELPMPDSRTTAPTQEDYYLYVFDGGHMYIYKRKCLRISSFILKK